MSEPYLILKSEISFQEEIKKSRFITYLAPIAGKEAALAYLQQIKKQHIDARHHCWAYIAASPKDSVQMGCSDDGEPKGTAGKPILSVLQGSGVGEMIAVVVRYSGGIKLGTGGLVRAYSNGVQQLVKQMQSVEKRFYFQYQLHCDYAQMALIESLLGTLSGRIVQVDYAEQVFAQVEVDNQLHEKFIKQLESVTQGKVLAKKINPSIS